jgi:hypothetical protein
MSRGECKYGALAMYMSVVSKVRVGAVVRYETKEIELSNKSSKYNRREEICNRSGDSYRTAV